MTLERGVADVPRGAVLHAREAGRRLPGVCAGETEGDAGVRDADGADRRGGSALQGRAQQAIGGLERMQRRNTVEAVQQGRRVQGAFRRHGPKRDRR